MDLVFDAIHWQLSGNELSPRIPALPVAGREYVRFGVPHLDGVGRDVLPLPVNNVANGVGFGTDGVEYVGTGAIAASPPQPKLVVVDDQDGGHATFTITESDPAATNQLYAAPYSTSLLLNWQPVGTLVGNGSLQVSLPKAFYAGRVDSSKGGGAATNLSNLFYVTCPYNATRVRIRDGVANSVWQIAQRLGFQCEYQSPGCEAITLWAVPTETQESAMMFGGETGTITLDINIPRQPGFPPPDGIVPGGRIKVAGVWFAYDARWPTETIDLAPVFNFHLRRLDISVEIDGTDV